MPEPIETKEVYFQVLEDGTVVFSADEFETWTTNLSEILRWVRDAKFQLKYYRGEE